MARPDQQHIHRLLLREEGRIPPVALLILQQIRHRADAAHNDHDQQQHPDKVGQLPAHITPCLSSFQSKYRFLSELKIDKVRRIVR